MEGPAFAFEQVGAMRSGSIDIPTIAGVSGLFKVKKALIIFLL